MANDHLINANSSGTQPWEEDDIDLLSGESSSTSKSRLDIVDRVYEALSADAQRADGILQRGDVNRTYLRKNLSIEECMAAEERLIAAGCQIIDKEEEIYGETRESLSQNTFSRHLTESEEKELGRKIQLAMMLSADGGNIDSDYAARIRKDAERAKAAFVETNRRYVEQIARRKGPLRHLTLEDIIQEGFIGLLHATDRYDPERGFRFKTYATWWIEQRIRRAIADCDRTIRLPVHVQEKFSRIRRSIAKLTLSRGRQPTLDELATAIGIEPDKLMIFLWRIHETDCAESYESSSDNSSPFSFVPDETESAFDSLVGLELEERIREVLATLSPREAAIMRMRFGIGFDTEYTLESIGQQYDVTRERIRQLEVKALKILRKPSRSCKLSDFLDE